MSPRVDTGAIPVTLHFGKGGLTAAIVEELREQVRRRRLVKVRLLPSVPGFDDTRAFCEELARQAGIRLVEVRGNTAVFQRPPRP